MMIIYVRTLSKFKQEMRFLEEIWRGKEPAKDAFYSKLNMKGISDND